MIPLMKNAFVEEYETKKALADFILKAQRLSMDKNCYEFERKFAKFQNRKHAILLNSGGSANLLMLQTFKNLGRLKDGDKIGFSGLTWSTNVMPIIQLGFIPVPVDCGDGSLNVMSSNLENTLEREDLQALFITNVLGFAGDLDTIKEICNAKDILFLEDNCEALGTEINGIKTGNFGIAASFSFFIAHHMSTIEGGMVCTDDDEFAEMAKIVRANGWDRNLNTGQQMKWRKKYGVKSELQAKYTFYDLAYNLRPTEITGFLGLTQLNYLEQNIAKREEYYAKLEMCIENNPDLIVPYKANISKFSPFALPIICKTLELRDVYLSQFSGAGVEIRPMIAGNMVYQPFFAKYVEKKYVLPNTDFIHKASFYCGLYPELTESDMNILSSCLQKYD